MPGTQSLMTTRRGEFRRLYRELARKPAVFASTPIIFCEGDSWFSTPLSMNLLDWLVFPTPKDEEKGVPLFGAGGLFFRTENSGDLAVDIFSQARIRDLVRWYKGFEFDLVLLSAGGNDFVDRFLKRTFEGAASMSVQDAFQRVVLSGRYDEVLNAYVALIEAFRKAKPEVPILAHTYDYPHELGRGGDLSLANVGAVALLKRGVGPWIGNRISHVLPKLEDQRLFARLLIDGFVERVLIRLRDDANTGEVFDFVDLRNTLNSGTQWFDEMHPTGAGFNLLAGRFRRGMRAKLDMKLG
jgi:hypothetical protein